MDQLPPDLTEPLRGALVTRLDAGEIARACGVLIERLVAETRATDAALASRPEPTLRDLLSSTRAAIR